MLIPSKMRKSVWLTPACALIAAAVLDAQDRKPDAQKTAKPTKPIRVDGLAKKTIEKWVRLQRHAGQMGVRKIRFDITVTSRGGMTGKWKASGAYAFDGVGDGVLEWKDKEIAVAMARRGWTATTLARHFQRDAMARRLAGTRVTARSRPNGTILTAIGGGRKEETFLLFDKKGVQIATVVGPMKKKLFYDLLDEKYVPSGETYTMPDARGDLTIWHTDVGGFHVPVKFHEVVKVKGQVLSDLTLVFKNHEINAGLSRPEQGAERKKEEKTKKKKTKKKKKKD
jgi:hypothetical protein